VLGAHAELTDERGEFDSHNLGHIPRTRSTDADGGVSSGVNRRLPPVAARRSTSASTRCRSSGGGAAQNSTSARAIIIATLIIAVLFTFDIGEIAVTCASKVYI
jgi:hypothetical protein